MKKSIKEVMFWKKNWLLEAINAFKTFTQAPRGQAKGQIREELMTVVLTTYGTVIPARIG
jgi:hypothetical protein